MTCIYICHAELDTIKCRAEGTYAKDPIRRYLSYMNLEFACAERRVGPDSLSTFSDTFGQLLLLEAVGKHRKE